MKHNTYYPTRTTDQVNWLVNWCNKLPGYATTLGLSPAQTSAALADALWLVYVLQAWLGAIRTWTVACTNAATDAQTGDGTKLCVLPVFAPPALPVGGTPVNTGALNRIFAVVQLIKESNGCTDAIASDLAIVGSVQPGPDLTTIAPVFTVTRATTGVNVNWGWGGNAAYLDMIELQVDRGDGKGYGPLVFDTTPGYLDTCPQPAVLTNWKYKGIYRVGEQRVGVWSQEMTIAGGG